MFNFKDKLKLQGYDFNKMKKFIKKDIYVRFIFLDYKRKEPYKDEKEIMIEVYEDIIDDKECMKVYNNM
ncbi:hypothetical protein [Clostridium baratii]|uniref:Uncharacterized protein n=1 Tax=Clostridium baratii TaxID=1561 RepID=A0A174VAP8_9CLOT|nr:hypothetical protein [Clostridium baratii]CUQ30556.1 Uncharacterised protein [Clostridium baratii]